MRLLLIVLIMVIATPCYAVEVCKPIDSQAWEEEQRHLVFGTVVAVAADNGSMGNFELEIHTNIVDGVTYPYEACFTDPDFNTDVITNPALEAKWVIIKAQIEAGNAIRQAELDEASQHLLGNEVNTITLQEAETWIDNQINSINNLDSGKEVMRTMFKKLAKFLVAKRIIR